MTKMRFQYVEESDYAKDIDDLMGMVEYLKKEGEWTRDSAKFALSVIRRKASAMMMRIDGFDLKGSTRQEYVGLPPDEQEVS